PLYLQARDAIDVVVGYSKDGFTPGAIDTDKTSIYDIIFTDEMDLRI
ncbi:9558_t:CDS:1, partial [Entrophospora sp. SA101]